MTDRWHRRGSAWTRNDSRFLITVVRLRKKTWLTSLFEGCEGIAYRLVKIQYDDVVPMREYPEVVDQWKEEYSV